MLLKELEIYNGQFPKEALQSIIDRRNEYIPELLNILEYTCQNADELAEQFDYFGHIYALYLLAQFRVKSAFPLVCRLVSSPHVDELLNDVITEGLPGILAALCDGEIEPIKELIENRVIDEFVRDSALKSLVILVARGIKTRDEIMAYFESLFRGKLAKDDTVIWGSLAQYCCFLYPDGVIGDIELAFEDERIDPMEFDLEEIKQQIENSQTDVLAALSSDSDFRFIDGTIAELEDWDCFNEDIEEDLVDWFRNN